MAFQTIWICEFSPKTPEIASFGGFDWFPEKDKDKCLNYFLTHEDSETHDLAMYSVTLPASFDNDQINNWCEDHYNIIPSYTDQDPPLF